MVVLFFLGYGRSDDVEGEGDVLVVELCARVQNGKVVFARGESANGYHLDCFR